MKVLIIPEDPTHDRYVLKPIVDRMMSDIRVRARVDVLTDPHLRGVGQALDESTVRGIVEDNPMVDLFIIMVDRDCDREGNETKAAARASEHGGRLLTCLAHQEVEVWALALHRDQLDESWPVVRDECDPKERYFDPFIAQKQWHGPGRGRKRAMRDLGRGFRGLLRVCDELAGLKSQIATWAGQRTA